jgi:hypothetical protein
VLWIGWLQWHIRTRGNAAVAEPVVHDYGNIECRDAVLAWDAQEPAYDGAGQLLSRWDGRTFKPHPVTGEPVPDEAAQVPQWRYVAPRKAAEWPQADFIVGNPPFIGAGPCARRWATAMSRPCARLARRARERRLRHVLVAGTPPSRWPAGRRARMGLITTNSCARPSTAAWCRPRWTRPAHLVFAIPDHPWVDSAPTAPPCALP